MIVQPKQSGFFGFVVQAQLTEWIVQEFKNLRSQFGTLKLGCQAQRKLTSYLYEYRDILLSILTCYVFFYPHRLQLIVRR